MLKGVHLSLHVGPAVPLPAPYEVVEALTSAEVTVYAKLPRGFAIPTPVGDYNPDWAIAFDSGKVWGVHIGVSSPTALRLPEAK